MKLNEKEFYVVEAKCRDDESRTFWEFRDRKKAAAFLKNLLREERERKKDKTGCGNVYSNILLYKKKLVCLRRV